MDIRFFPVYRQADDGGSGGAGGQASGGAGNSANTGSAGGSSAGGNSGEGADPDDLPEGEQFDPERAKALIAKLRGEVKAGKSTARELAAAQGKLKEYEQSQLSEMEKRDQRIKELETENGTLKTAQQRTQAERAADRAGALYPDVIAGLIPAEALSDPKALEARIAELRTQRPGLFKAQGGSGDGGAGGGNASGKTMNDLIRQAAGR